MTGSEVIPPENGGDHSEAPKEWHKLLLSGRETMEWKRRSSPIANTGK